MKYNDHVNALEILAKYYAATLFERSHQAELSLGVGTHPKCKCWVVAAIIKSYLTTETERLALNKAHFDDQKDAVRFCNKINDEYDILANFIGSAINLN